ncbi:MAG: SIMPL domain-containing protein [Candidatus Azobacteroides sp.]|nr:SIMPL domain-containing protein [Candidatus Azobacteroides sp.]
MMTTRNQILWIFAMILFFATGCSRNDQKNNPQSYVEVQGSAEKEIDPDIFYLNITLSETNGSQKNDINVLEQKLLAVMESLKINTKTNLSVTGMSGDNWYWWRKNRKLYQNKSYLLKTSNLDLLNSVCDKLDNLGGYVNYYLSKTDYSKMDELKKEVQQEAVKQARVKAENLLSGENQKVDELIYLQESEPYNQTGRFNYEYANKMEAADAAPSTIDFQKMKVSYDVIARFSIK